MVETGPVSTEAFGTPIDLISPLTYPEAERQNTGSISRGKKAHPLHSGEGNDLAHLPILPDDLIRQDR